MSLCLLVSTDIQVILICSFLYDKESSCEKTLGACLSKVSPAGKKCDLPSSGYRISSINQEIRWETLSAGSDNLYPQAIF